MNNGCGCINCTCGEVSGTLDFIDQSYVSWNTPELIKVSCHCIACDQECDDCECDDCSCSDEVEHIGSDV